MFTFAPVSVTVGSTYVIRFQATKDTFSWWRQTGGDPYGGGRAMQSEFILPNDDWTFRNWGSSSVHSASVGGVIQPTNILVILAPYLMAIGFVATTGVAVTVKRRRKV